jgi:hypothetical protein
MLQQREKKVEVVLFKVRWCGEGDVCVTTGIANAPRRAAKVICNDVI